MQLAAYRSSIRKRMKILTVCLTFSKHLPMKSAIDITKDYPVLLNFDIPPKQIRNSIYHLSWKNQMEKVIKEL